jgi:hypothetical protein
MTGPDEQERRGVSALLAVINSVREFGRASQACPGRTLLATVLGRLSRSDG